MGRCAAVLVAFLMVTPPASADDAAERAEIGRILDEMEAACEQKYWYACKFLERAYLTGGGIDIRPEKGRAFLRGVCSVGYDKPGPCMSSTTGLACRRVAEIYKCGQGVAKDLRMAAAYYRTASARGDAVSSVELARLLESGEAIPRDGAGAHAALRRACSQKSFLSVKCGSCKEEMDDYDKVVAGACERVGLSASGPAADVKDSEVFARVGAVQEPRKLVADPPVYPKQAREARVQGDVRLEAVVDVDGHVVGVRVKQGIPMLDAAAVAAVKQWVYTPTLVDGMPVPVILDVTVTFRLT
jgi:TonB family protein